MVDMQAVGARDDAQATERGEHYAVAFTTDESPPSEPRFAGLRFQITFVHVLFYKPVEEWQHYITEHPFVRTKSLCDIMHVPEKTGIGTLNVLMTQFERKGIYQSDIVSASTDGGGENEGHGGIHRIMETANDSYVRRRCMLHLAWRVADAGCRGMDRCSHYDISAYLRDGITWTRLLTIAVRSEADGGLGIMVPASNEYCEFSKTRPPKIMEDRPETELTFLRWLLPRQVRLAKLVEHDMTVRQLKFKQATRANASLNDPLDCIFRHIHAVMLHKSMYLYYKYKSQHWIASTSVSFDDLVDHAAKIILDMRLDDHVLLNFDTTLANIAISMHLPQSACTAINWVEFVITWADVGISENGVEWDDVMATALKEHENISTKAAAHLMLTASNIARSHWLSARILHTDPSHAQAGARAFRDHLVRSNGGQTPYEKHWINNDSMMSALGIFSDREVACCLWHGNGAFAILFYFRAGRFLSAPDSVMECEGVHARWKWICEHKRNLRIGLLNAILKLTVVLESYGDFPGTDALAVCKNDLRQTERASLHAVRASGTIAPSLQGSWLMQKRFNLSPEDINLLRAAVGTAPTLPSTPEVDWGQYIRFMMERSTMYRHSWLGDTYCYVCDNRSLPGREMPGEGDAIMRAITIAFFEVVESDDDTNRATSWWCQQ